MSAFLVEKGIKRIGEQLTEVFGLADERNFAINIAADVLARAIISESPEPTHPQENDVSFRPIMAS